MTEPDLTPEERAALGKAAAEFNAAHFFECHDTLEDMWAGHRGPGRDFFQGLIQVAVGFHHFGNGNLAGAESMFSRALKRLAPYPDRYCGFDLAAHRAEVERWRARAASGTIEGVTSADLPTWRFA
jgi:predicted metal-dependent hydrolase